jgi:hypothetical protein
MKYALSEDRTSVPPPGQSQGQLGIVQNDLAVPGELPTEDADERSLALTLDQLAREVLSSNRPLQEAWEELRQQVVSRPRRTSQ